MADDIVIVGATRTPVGSFNGAFANLPAHELGQIAIKAALERAGIEGKRVSEVIMGQILSAGTLAIAPMGGINLHGSILPAYRGAAPVARAIQNGETETGVTVIRMTPRIDAGGKAVWRYSGRPWSLHRSQYSWPEPRRSSLKKRRK